MKIDRKKLEEVGEYLRGTCKSTGDAIVALELGDDIDDCQLEADLLVVDVEQCVGCNWWHQVFELVFVEARNGGMCDDCREEDGIED